jgi:hypothetical protein
MLDVKLERDLAGAPGARMLLERGPGEPFSRVVGEEHGPARPQQPEPVRGVGIPRDRLRLVPLDLGPAPLTTWIRLLWNISDIPVEPQAAETISTVMAATSGLPPTPP